MADKVGKVRGEKDSSFDQSLWPRAMHTRSVSQARKAEYLCASIEVFTPDRSVKPERPSICAHLLRCLHQIGRSSLKGRVSVLSYCGVYTRPST
jgi:hypothetical protein